MVITVIQVIKVYQPCCVFEVRTRETSQSSAFVGCGLCCGLKGTHLLLCRLNRGYEVSLMHKAEYQKGYLCTKLHFVQVRGLAACFNWLGP